MKISTLSLSRDLSLSLGAVSSSDVGGHGSPLICLRGQHFFFSIMVRVSNLSTRSAFSFSQWLEFPFVYAVSVSFSL